MSNIIFLYDPTFPYDGQRPGNADLERLGEAGRIVAVHELAAVLNEMQQGTLVTLHAPYVPKEAWADMLAFLRRGGNLISMGGAPFKNPVRKQDGNWIIEASQTAYHQQLHIHESLSVDATPVQKLSAVPQIPLFKGKEGLFEITDTWNLVPHVTKNSELPHQMGSAGSMDTQIYAVMKGISVDSREVAAPAVLWEHSRGSFVGSRWLLINQSVSSRFWEQGGAEALLEWADFCAQGVTEISVKPGYAAYLSGERPLLTLQAQHLNRAVVDGDYGESWKFRLSVQLEGSKAEAWSTDIDINVGAACEIKRIQVPVDVEPGLYQLTCEAKSQHGEVRILQQGYWGHDAKLLGEGSPITCDRDYFIKDGRPLPVVGMTYMSSDVARKFLFLPNASVWDRDMAQMANAGINWIRTGIWTAYRNIMQADGHASEEVLRSIDAFLLTAKKHGLQVTFTFFSFTPEPWEGLNPYLDPRSLEAQKRFIRSITLRHQHTTHVDWDLINEPSMFDPVQIFSDGPRSMHDPFEQAAYVEWLEKRHGNITTMQERWNMTPEQLPDFASVKPPEPSEINFDIQDIHQGKKGTRWLDYALFSMEMHNRWASELVGAIKRDNRNQLVTVGQDEALGAQRPSPFFYGKAVDYTTVHSWWLNDHLVWDSIFAKTPNKPNLVQETGMMYVETPDGRAKRSEQELRSILERKYAYAFATGGAGAVQWIWNTNFYMDNANESHIGALRADGTEKPEADVSYDFGRFMADVRDMFVERELEDVVVIFPYSNDFSNRKLAFDGTTQLTRVLSYELNVPFRAIGEYQIEELQQYKTPKLIILPSAHNIDDTAWDQLISYVTLSGTTLLLTGTIGLDAYWHETNRLSTELGEFGSGNRRLSNVRREEVLEVGGKQLPVSFGNRRIAQVMKEIPSGEALDSSVSKIQDISLGKGRLLWCPLPIELNDRTDTIAELYRHALKETDYEAELTWISGGNAPGVYGRKLDFKDGSLFIFVSEYVLDTPVEVKNERTGCSYTFTLPQERSVLFATDASGIIRTIYRPDETQVKMSRQAGH